MTADLAAAGREHRRGRRRRPLSAALGEVQSNVTEEEFEDMVERAKEDIRAGEVFQVVLSQRFSMPCRADALDVYRALRVVQPQPLHVPVPPPDAGRHGIRRRRLQPRRPWSR